MKRFIGASDFRLCGHKFDKYVSVAGMSDQVSVGLGGVPGQRPFQAESPVTLSWDDGASLPPERLYRDVEESVYL